MPSVFSIIQTIIVLIAVIFLANFLLKLLNKNMLKQNRMIKVMEKSPVYNNSSIGIVQVCGSYYLMSFTDKDNRILKELSLDEVEKYLKQNEENDKIFSFMDIKNGNIGMRKKVE